MVNTRAKGNRTERKAEDRLKEQGYSCSRMPHTRYGDSDHFNLFDILAVQPGEPVKFIQVKTNTPPNLSEFKEKALETAPLKHGEIEIWTWHDYQGWKIRELNRVNKEWEIIKDET